MAIRATIVCALDNSCRAQRVALASRRLAETLGARVVLVHVFDPRTVPAPPARELDGLLTSQDIEEHERRRALAAFAETAAIMSDDGHATIFADGDPRSELLRVLHEHDAGLLITGSAARTPLDRVMQGSLPAELAVEAPCPVVVVNDAAELVGAGPLLVAYDGSEHSLRAARHGAALAAGLGRDLVLMHVAQHGRPGVDATPDLARELHAAARSCASSVSARAARRVDVTVAIERGDPVEQLLHAAVARAASLVVVGTRGRNALKAALLGSVSAAVVSAATRPVVVAGPRSEEVLMHAPRC